MYICIYIYVYIYNQGHVKHVLTVPSWQALTWHLRSTGNALKINSWITPASSTRQWIVFADLWNVSWKFYSTFGLKQRTDPKVFRGVL